MMFFDVGAESAISVLRKTFVKEYKYEPWCSFETVIKELLALQVTDEKILFGGVDSESLFCPFGVSVSKTSLLDALLQAEEYCFYHPAPNPIPPGGSFRVSRDIDDPTKIRLWYKFGPGTPSDYWYPEGSLGRRVGQQLRYRKNIKGFSKKVDYSTIVNKLYAFGSPNGFEQWYFYYEMPHVWMDADWLYISFAGWYEFYDNVKPMYQHSKDGDPIPEQIKVVNVQMGGTTFDMRQYCVQGANAWTIKYPTGSYYYDNYNTSYWLSEPGAWHYLETALDCMVWDQDSIDQYGTKEGIIEGPEAPSAFYLQLLGQQELNRTKAPRLSYNIALVDLADLQGFDFERLELGSLVNVIDEEFDLDVETRVMSLEKQYDQRGNLQVSLENTSQLLGDLFVESTRRFYKLMIRPKRKRGNREMEYWDMYPNAIMNGNTGLPQGIYIDLSQYDPLDRGYPSSVIFYFKCRCLEDLSGFDNWLQDGGIRLLGPGFSRQVISFTTERSCDFETTISGLDYEGLYFYRCYAQNEIGIDWAPETRSFTVIGGSVVKNVKERHIVKPKSITIPEVVNIGVTDIENVDGVWRATLLGRLVDSGGARTQLHFCWGKTDGGTSVSSWGHNSSAGTGGDSVFGVDKNSFAPGIMLESENLAQYFQIADMSGSYNFVIEAWPFHVGFKLHECNFGLRIAWSG